MRLDLEADGVFTLDLTVKECREMDTPIMQSIEEALDQTQAFVFGEQGDIAYLVIKVTQGDSNE